MTDARLARVEKFLADKEAPKSTAREALVRQGLVTAEAALAAAPADAPVGEAAG